MNISKDEIRRRLLDLRQALPASVVESKSRSIAKRLIDAVDWAAIRSVHIYQSVPEWKEVETNGLISALQSMANVELTVQPAKKGSPIPTKKFDLIIVPVVGYDSDNYRIGRGAGWYDRFLATQPLALKVGLAYREAFINNLPHQPHDIQLDQIITD